YQGCIPRSYGSHQAVAVHLGHVPIHGFEGTQRRDVLDRAVTEFRLDAQPIAFPGRERLFRRRDPQLRNPRLVDWIEPCSRRDPAAQDLVVRAAHLHPLAALVGSLCGSFLEQETGLRMGAVEPPAGKLAGEAEMIQGRISPKQAQTETILALDRAMADTAVAAQPAEHGHHMATELRGSAGLRSG